MCFFKKFFFTIILSTFFIADSFAEITYLQILKDPTDLRLNLQYAKEQESKGRFKAVIATLERLNALYPNNIDLKLAAASTLQGLTAQYLTKKSWEVKNHHFVLIHAASGGVGQILTQLSKFTGATVIGTVGNDYKASIAKTNGCDFVINYSNENFESKVNNYTNKHGADVIYDAVGKDTFEKGLKCLAKRGRIVSYGISSGKIDPIDGNVIPSTFMSLLPVC